ncbi:MAG: tRNA (adenine(22)-N(1))-methyltransferase [Suipraeoptans sp.]
MENYMELSKRLQMVVDMVDKGSNVADIGTDHGYVPIYLKLNNIANNIIAMDVGKGPLSHASSNIKCHRLEEYIETRLSDGLAAINPYEVDTVLIGGMGGELTIKILTEGEKVVKSLRSLILQPQSEIWKVRKFINENDMTIIKENMVLEEGHFYPVIKVGKGKESEYTNAELYFGRCLLKDRNKILYDFIIREKLLKNKILTSVLDKKTSNSQLRVNELKSELEIIEDALSYYK